jgi:hypothetical protein
MIMKLKNVFKIVNTEGIIQNKNIFSCLHTLKKIYP